MTKLYLIITAIVLATLVTIGIVEEAEAQFAPTVVCEVRPYLWYWGWGTRTLCCTRTWNGYGFYTDHHCLWQ